MLLYGHRCVGSFNFVLSPKLLAGIVLSLRLICVLRKQLNEFTKSFSTKMVSWFCFSLHFPVIVIYNPYSKKPSLIRNFLFFSAMESKVLKGITTGTASNLTQVNW